VGSYLASSPAVFDGKFYLASLRGEFSCVDLKSKEALWSVSGTEGSETYASPAADGTGVIFADRDGSVKCLSAKDGKKLWGFDAGSSVDSSPVIAGDFIYFGTDAGQIFGLNRKDGSVAWKYEAGGHLSGSPAISDGRLFIGSSDGILYCFK